MLSAGRLLIDYVVARMIVNISHVVYYFQLKFLQ